LKRNDPRSDFIKYNDLWEFFVEEGRKVEGRKDKGMQREKWLML
jgi:hypothetical protein